MKTLFPVHTYRSLALGLVLAISMVSVSYGIDGVLPGDGLSESTAYLIEDLTDFDVFADQANSGTYWSSGVYTKLTCDIDLTGRAYTTAVIAPGTFGYWGFKGRSFLGVFDGDGHIISNFTIDTAGAEDDCFGLFGGIRGVVKNLCMIDVSITAGDNSDYLGGLCGYNHGTISDCYANVSVTGGAGSCGLGGLCGCNWSGGTITNCYATGAVTGAAGSEILGGLCGRNYGTITNCYASGNVAGGNDLRDIGGLCGFNGSGYNGDYGAIINNCYATGSVTGGDEPHNLGGLCGDNSWGTITNCYATGLVVGGYNSRTLAGLCGTNTGGIITNCFWNIETSSMAVGYRNAAHSHVATITNLVGKTTAQMWRESTFTSAGWDFVDTWQMPVGDYPRLAWETFGAHNIYPPVIQSLSASPDPVTQGDHLKLTANNVTDSDGNIVKVEFYIDSNNNGQLDVNSDVLLGTDSSSSGGWTWTGSTAGFNIGQNCYFAQAQDDDGDWGDYVETNGTVFKEADPVDMKILLAFYQPGTYIPAE